MHASFYVCTFSNKKEMNKSELLKSEFETTNYMDLFKLREISNLLVQF